MPRCSLLFVLALAVIGAANGTKTDSQAFLPRNKALTIRGGAGPLDVVQTAKIATAINGINSGIVWLSPKKCAEIYSVKLTPTSALVTKRVGATMLGSSLMAYCLLFKKNTSVNAAIAVGQLPFLLTMVGDFLNGESKDIGMPQAPQMLVTALSAFLAHSCLAGASYVDDVVKAFAVWITLNGISCSLFVDAACKLWGLGVPDPNTRLAVKQLGFSFLGMGALIFALNQGIDAKIAIGYSWIPMLAMMIDMNFITKEVETLDMPPGPVLLWLAMTAVFVATLAFD